MAPKLIKAKEIMSGDEIGIRPNHVITIGQPVQTDTVQRVTYMGDSFIKIVIPDGSTLRYEAEDEIWLFNRPLHNWGEAKDRVPERATSIDEHIEGNAELNRIREASLKPIIDDYEVKIVFNDGTKTALYFKELDFIKDLGWTNVDRIVITARWK